MVQQVQMELMPGASAGFALYVNGDQYNSGSFYGSSDRKLKENIVPIESPLAKLLQLNGYTYNFKPDLAYKYGFTGGKNYGVIADEVQKVFPELTKNTTIISKGKGNIKQSTDQ